MRKSTNVCMYVCTYVARGTVFGKQMAAADGQDDFTRMVLRHLDVRGNISPTSRVTFVLRDPTANDDMLHQGGSSQTSHLRLSMDIATMFVTTRARGAKPTTATELSWRLSLHACDSMLIKLSCHGSQQSNRANVTTMHLRKDRLAKCTYRLCVCVCV